jgi:hypothetical protein
MAVTGIAGGAEVVKLGGAVEERVDYLVGEVYAKGDLIRLASGGTIKLAEADSAGAIHGMALKVGVVDEVAKILLFADDTQVSLPTIDGESPADLTKSVAYDLAIGTGAFAVTATTDGSSIATVVGYADDGFPFVERFGSFDQDSTVDNNRVIVRFKQAILDGNVA